MNAINRYTTLLRKNHTSEKYWYLTLIGVDPIHQGKGFGSKLIRPMLKYIDTLNLPVLLETHTEINTKIYQNFGFKIIESNTVPNTNIPHWLMRREPKGQ